MRCNVCDRPLSEAEVIWNEDLKTFEMCTTCLDISLEAAFSGDFKRQEKDHDPIFEEENGDGEVEILEDPGLLFSYNDSSDSYQPDIYESEYDE